MDFAPQETDRVVRELAATVLATAVPADLGLTGFDDALWQRLGEAGLLTLSLPEEAGGGGLGLTAAVILAEETGRVAARVPLVAVLAVAPLLAGRLPDGLVVPALDEAGVDDAMRPTVRAERDGEGWRLTGTRLAVAWAAHATHLVVSATAEDRQPLLALVSLRSPGLALTEESTTSGEPAATVRLEAAPAETLAVGPAGLEQMLTRLTLLRAGYALGVAETCLAMAAEHVTHREQFGRPLAAFQAVTCRVADAWIDTEALRMTVQQAVWRVDEGLPAAEATAVAAFWASDAVHRVSSSAVHLHGGLGVDVSFPLHRWFLAAKLVELQIGGASRSLERLGDLLAVR